jgi:hypothetical protein
MQQYYEIWVMYESRSITEGNKEDEYVWYTPYTRMNVEILNRLKLPQERNLGRMKKNRDGPIILIL